MTDTTDTAALSDQFKSIRDDVEFYEGTQHCIAVPIKLAKALLDQLEAERQRADEVRVGLESEISHSNRCIAKINTIEAELAALKAKLANPVVLTDCTFEAVSHMAHWYSEGECVAWVSGAEHVKKQILEAGFTVKEE